MRKKILAGNWKMNLTLPDARALAEGVASAGVNGWPEHVSVVVAPPFVAMETVGRAIEGTAGLHLAAQNCHQETAGAYTGEVAAPMVRALGADFVILGHSERRSQFGEGTELLKAKTDAALASGLRPIFCCGESLEERKSGQYQTVVKTQLEQSLFHLSPEAFAQVVIAYEPVWAIGTGETASPEQAQEVHALIRALVAGHYGQAVADDLSILYGGSCKPSNARELFSQQDVDGGLIGGASLSADDFTAIINAWR